MSITLPEGITLPQETSLASLLGGLGTGIGTGAQQMGTLGLRELLKGSQALQKKMEIGKQKILPFFNQQLTKLGLDKKLDPDVQRQYQDRAMELFSETGDYVGASTQAIDEMIAKTKEPTEFGEAFRKGLKGTETLMRTLMGLPMMPPIGEEETVPEEIIPSKQDISPTKEFNEEIALEFWKKAPGKTRDQKEKNAIKMARAAGYKI